MRHTRFPVLQAVLLMFAVILSMTTSRVYAQADANKGQIIGTVLDPGGAVVPGAKIVVRNTATGFQRETTTSGDGLYRLVALDAGTYELTVTDSPKAR